MEQIVFSYFLMYHPLAKEMQPSLNFFVLSPPTMQISYVVILMEG
jgi:hypothetical protein